MGLEEKTRIGGRGIPFYFLRQGAAVWRRRTFLLCTVIILFQPLDQVCWLPSKHLVAWAAFTSNRHES